MCGAIRFCLKSYSGLKNYYNYGTHKHSKVGQWLTQRPRFKLHFMPTSASWTNLVERWFRELTEKAIRRGAFVSVADPEAAIQTFLHNYNDEAKPFVWTASADAILTQLEKVKAIYDTLHPVYVKNLACPHCQTAVKSEASVCLGCGAEIVRGACRHGKSTVGGCWVAVVGLVLTTACSTERMPGGLSSMCSMFDAQIPDPAVRFPFVAPSCGPIPRSCISSASMEILLAILLLSLLLTGCASDEEDRNFFNGGWLRPEAGAQERMNSQH